MKMTTLMLAAMALSLATGATRADDLYPWNDHAGPYSFRFGNDLDHHQQTRKLPDGSLAGFFYVGFSGVETRDGYRVATHVDCNAKPCNVGWTLNGQPGMAAFLYQAGSDHPVFLASRQDIPEPGAHGHFHWLDYEGQMPPVGMRVPGYLLQLKAVDTFCFIHDMAQAVSARKSKTCQGNGGIEVNPGIDIATHLNVVTSYPSP